ncbi:hypothetical protein PSOL_07020 [Candidatus Phytoplasma solani]
MINDIVRYYTLNDQGKAFFFFDPSQLNEIKQVDITFCDCDMSPSFITSVIDFVSNLTDFLETANFDDKNYIKKKINQKVGHAIAKTALKKGTKKVVGNTWGKIVFPEVFEAIDMAEKKYESFASKKENILFDIKNNSYEKTLGFVLRFPSKNELKLYELKKDSNNNSVYRLIKRVNFSDSSHMLINLIQPKHGLEMEPQKNLTVYCGKLKK